MKSPLLYAQVVPALLAGSSRQPLPDDASPLELLSLAGQALRFVRPPAPLAFTPEPEITDPRRILPGALRRPLVRLLANNKLTEHPARALARAFDTLGLRPHPFDFPALEAFVRAYADALGPTAESWAERQQPGDEAAGYFEERLDDTNWSAARPARRVAYLSLRRRADANGARQLLEPVWAAQNADTRFRLLQVLQIGLSAEDQAFLTSLQKDRAPRVRSLASRLLARLGVDSQNPALAACLERIERKQTGLLRKRPTLRLDIPAQLKDDAIPRWMRETFAEVSLAELTRALGLNELELIEASAKQEELLLALSLLATSEIRLDLLTKIVEHLPHLWDKLFACGLDDLGAMSSDERQRWIEILAAPYGRNLPEYYAWDWLHRVTGCAAPPSLMAAVLASQRLDPGPNFEVLGPTWLELLAAMCPPASRPALRHRIAQHDPALTTHAQTLLEILEGMETHHA